VDWQAVVHQWLDAGETIVALGEYRGVYKATGRSTTAAFAHVYDLRTAESCASANTQIPPRSASDARLSQRKQIQPVSGTLVQRKQIWLSSRDNGPA